MSYHREITREGVMEAEPLAFDRPRITISTTVQYRGRVLIVTAEGLDADKFCDLLDKRFGEGHTAPGAVPYADIPPVCPVHNRSMKAMKFADKRGHTWKCTAKVGDDWCAERA